MSKEKQKISVLLSCREFELFEAYCVEKGFKKSTLLAKMIRDLLDRDTGGPREDNRSIEVRAH